MYRSLATLRYQIDKLIAEQGESASCAAFIFTKDDVFYYENDEEGFPDLNEEKHLNPDDTDDVLIEIGCNDYIYSQVNEMIEDEVMRIRRRTMTVREPSTNG
jgi:hypothetical protein